MSWRQERWREVEAIFHAALERAEPERARFLEDACQGDAELHDEVRSLLRFDRKGQELLGAGAPSGGGKATPALSSGVRLGAYEILGLVGAGGMGEVYRARDTRLGREVAVKVLPAELTRDAGRRERFEREARAISRLSHPHICSLYDVGREGDKDFLVMEYLEGESLAERLRRGPLPLDEALEVAVQITEALEAAHRRGVVHRDLKPGNVMLTRSGAKLLDFSLAKLTPPVGLAGEEGGRSDDELEAAFPGTRPGLVLGTLHYMAPEQLEGLPVDARTDVFIFGCLFFEILTGERAFQGSSPASVVAAILRAEAPRLAPELERELPPGLQRLVDRCLSKRPDDRWQSIGDVGHLLRDARDGREVDPTRTSAPGRALPRWSLVLAGLVIAAATWPLGWIAGKGTPPPRSTTRSSVLAPSDRPVARDICFPCRGLAISPDGSRLVYLAESRDGPPGPPGSRWRLQHRSLGSFEVEDLPGTSGASQPFFSPDGRWVAFFTGNGELRKLSLSGGDPVSLLDGLNGSRWRFGAWARDGTIVLDAPTGGLASLSAEGGPTASLTTVDEGAGESRHGFPALLPGRRVVLFTVLYRDSDRTRIDAVDRDSGERWVVAENAYAPQALGSGHLLFQRGRAVMVAPLDPDRVVVSGPAVPLDGAVQVDNRARSSLPLAQLAVSRTGTIAYVPVAERPGTIGRVGRDGGFEALGIPPGPAETPRVSPDGHAVAYIEARGSGSVVRVHDLTRGSSTKLGAEGRVRWLAWHPDGQSVAVGSEMGIVSRRLDGSEELLVPARDDVRLRDFSWSPDGRRLAYTTQAGSRYDVWVTTFAEPFETTPVLRTEAMEYGPAFSPDGRWLAYGSDESGRHEVYVRRFPSGRPFTVSTEGGSGPVWSPDGREIYFQGVAQGRERLFSVSVSATDGNGLRLGAPVPLFDSRAAGADGLVREHDRSSVSGISYDVLPDGQGFLMVQRAVEPDGGREILLVQNFHEELTRLAPNAD